jgi:hypothetical protein
MGSVRSRAVGVAVLVAAVVWMLVPGAASAAKPITVCASGCSYTSVQAAIDAAPSGATISIAAGTYVEAVTVGKSVTLAGAGAGQTILASPGSGRTVSIDAGSVVTIKSLRVTTGGIENSGTLTLVASSVTGNAARYGAGILNEGTATLKDSTVSGNSSSTLWAACSPGFDITCTGGAGINNPGTLMLNHSTVSDNVSHGFGGGITSTGSLTLNGTTVMRNSSYRISSCSGPDLGCGPSGGGGLVVGGSFTANNSTISNNTADDGGGGIEIGDVAATLKGTIVTGNFARTGGGILNYGNATLTNSTIAENTAWEQGGGIYNDDGGLISMRGTTVSGNSAGTKGGGIYNHDFGLLMFWTSTITGNSALQGGGIYNDNYTAAIPVWMVDGMTTVSGNNPDDCANC